VYSKKGNKENLGFSSFHDAFFYTGIEEEYVKKTLLSCCPHPLLANVGTALRVLNNL
jgi:hypothetical protein